MKKTKLLIALLLCLLVMAALIPTALAAQSTVTIESQTNSAFDYLEYYADGQWKDLNTPRHWIESTGEIVYCVEHAASNPHGQTYTLTSPESVFSSSTLSGLNSIFMYGYPNTTPSGFTADEARQATACAIRFWLSEQGEAESYTFTNRAANPGYIRAKSGYEHVLEWADELLYKARARQEMTHSITFSPSSVTLSTDGSSFTGQTAVQLVNINSGYQLNTNSLPTGSNVSGYTGSRSETLTITVPNTAAGQSFSLSATAYDTRSVDNISAYVPASGGLQKIFLCATGVQPVATATVTAAAPAYGYVKIVKNGENNAPLPGVKFGVYSDSGCSNQLTQLTTGSDGTVTSGELSAGTVYIEELSTVSPYVISTEVKSATIATNTTASVTFTNAKAQGKIRIEKTGDVLTSGKTQDSPYGSISVPSYTKRGLAGVRFTVKNAGGTVVATLTTNAYGVAETGALPFGEYTVQETGAPAGYVPDGTERKVTLAYKDQNTPIVTATVAVENTLQTGGVKIRKITELYNYEKIDFYNALAEGYVFGLYTAEDIGDIPANALVEVLITDDQGIAQTAAKLPYGNYYLKELAVPVETIEMLTDRLSLTLDSEWNVAYYDSPIYNTMFKAKIGVYKLDAANSERGLAGAVFEVRDEAGKLFDTMTTNEKGYAESIEIPVGTYKVKEVTPPAGFILSDEVKTVTLTTEDKSTATFELTNKANGVTLTKTDLTTEAPIPSATVEIYGKDGKVFFKGVTDQDGRITAKELPAGTYTFKETISPDGYAINANTFTFSIDVYGKVTGTTAFTDEPTVLTVMKMDTYTGKPFAGIEFKLLDAEGKAVKTKLTDKGYRMKAEDGEETFKVDEKGYAEFRYLPVGKYSLVETVPTGYIADGTTEFELTTAHAKSTPLALTINNCPTGLTISKIDASTNKALTGASFRVKVKSGLGFATLTFTKQTDGKYVFDESGTVMDLPVDSNGQITIIGLPVGVVWIEESVTPDGYFPISAIKTEITKEATATKPLALTVKNSKFVKLGMDSDWWEFPALLAGIVLVLGGGITVLILRKKKSSGMKARIR